MPDAPVSASVSTAVPRRILVFSHMLGDAQEAGSAEALAPDCTVVAHADCRSLVRDALEQVPDALLVWLPVELARQQDMLTALADLSARLPSGLSLPAVCIAPVLSPALLQNGPALGLKVWLPAMPPAAVLQQHVCWAAAQAGQQAAHSAHLAHLARLHAEAQALQEQLADARRTLDERKWTDRAKGLLMAAQSLDEAEAYRLLRDAAMHAHLRLGEVARSVVQAATMAEAVNLAGQQRMLSQRLVKLLAQRLAGIEVRRAKVLQDESCGRVEANLARLKLLLTGEPAHGLQQLSQAWAQLAGLLKQRLEAGRPGLLAQADAAAEVLLQEAEGLTALIESASPGRPLQVVNLCGRQRMLSQRVAKQALLADLLTGADPLAITASLSAFEAGLNQLDAAPLSSPGIRATLAEVRAEWLRLLRSLRETQGAAAGLARSSEALLTLLDQLTVQYQQSLQLILA